MARGLVRTDAAHAFGRWLMQRPGIGPAAVAHLTDGARHGEAPGVGLLVSWLAESGLGPAADAPPISAPLRAPTAPLQAIYAICQLAGKHGVRPAQLVAAVISDLSEADGRVVWRLSARRGCAERVVALDDEDMGLLRLVVESGHGAGTRPGPTEPLLGRGWTTARARTLLNRRARSGNGARGRGAHRGGVVG